MSAAQHPGDIDMGPVGSDEYTCPDPFCDFVIGAAGPLTAGVDDEFRDEIAAHQRRHEPKPTTTATCVYDACDGAHITTTDSADLDAWMDQHAATVEHDTRWPVSFRIDYQGSSLPGVAYRDARAADDLDPAPEPLPEDAREVFQPRDRVLVGGVGEGRVTSIHDGLVWVSVKDPLVNTGWRPANGYEPAQLELLDAEDNLIADPVGALTAPPGVELVPPPGMTPEARQALADRFTELSATGRVTLASAVRSLTGHPFQVGHRVEYIGPDADLRGKHGTIALERAFPAHPRSTAVGVRFDGHGATWSILPLYLALLDPEPVRPTIPSDGVPATEPAPSDGTTPSLVQLDRADAANHLIERVLNWETHRKSGPVIADLVERSLLRAVADYREAADR